MKVATFTVRIDDAEWLAITADMVTPEKLSEMLRAGIQRGFPFLDGNYITVQFEGIADDAESPDKPG